MKDTKGKTMYDFGATHMRKGTLGSALTVEVYCGGHTVYLATAEDGDTERTGSIPCLVEYYTKIGLYCKPCERLHESAFCNRSATAT